jgi:hypothetical protein
LGEVISGGGRRQGKAGLKLTAPGAEQIAESVE